MPNDSIVLVAHGPECKRRFQPERALHASAHSANLGLPSFSEGVRGEWLAAALGLDTDPLFPPKLPVRRAIEVYPHTAIVALFGLATTLKYKAKPGQTLATRATALAELMQHLQELRDADPRSCRPRRSTTGRTGRPAVG